MMAMRTNIFFLMALLPVCSALYAQTPDSLRVETAPDTMRVETASDTMRVETASDTASLTASADTAEVVPYRSLQMGIPAGESGPTFKDPNLRYSNQVRVGGVSFERRNENQRPSAEPNIPVSTPDGRTINSNSKPGAGFSMSWGK